MKKSPRKFQAGGATPAPATKPAPKGGPKELQEEAEKVRQEKREAATQQKGAEKPNLGKLFKKGGAVRKFEVGGDVTQDTRERRADERKEPAPIENRTSPEAPKAYNRPTPLPSGNEARDAETATNPNTKFGRFSDDTYSKAYAQANRLTTPSGEVEKEVKAKTGLEEPSVAKPKVAPKAAPKAAAPKPTPKSTSGSDSAFKRKLDFAGEGDSNADTRQEGPRKRGLYERGAGPMLPSPTKLEAPGGATAFERRREERLQREAKERMEARKNRTAASYAKGGGVEAKGKTKGKIVKMAKGGSVRGYGVSKVTNKTKYV
jgi:hypothetical protein